MQNQGWWLALGILLLTTLSSAAQVIKGVMSVTGAEMSWWGGLVRDTIARQLDVDKDSVTMEIEPGKGSYRNGTITFTAKKGKSVDLAKIHKSLKATRLGGKTRSGVNYLEITATGDVKAMETSLLLKVTGTTQVFRLGDDPKAKLKDGGKTPFRRLQEAVAKGSKVTSVTGRVDGWKGVWPKVLQALPGQTAKDSEKPPRPAAQNGPLLLVTDFQTAKE